MQTCIMPEVFKLFQLTARQSLKITLAATEFLMTK